MSLFLEATNKSLAHETVYPDENTAFSEVCQTYSNDDQELIAEEYLYVWDAAEKANVPFDYTFFEIIEPSMSKKMVELHGRA